MKKKIKIFGSIILFIILSDLVIKTQSNSKLNYTNSTLTMLNIEDNFKSIFNKNINKEIKRISSNLGKNEEEIISRMIERLFYLGKDIQINIKRHIEQKTNHHLLMKKYLVSKEYYNKTKETNEKLSDEEILEFIKNNEIKVSELDIYRINKKKSQQISDEFTIMNHKVTVNSTVYIKTCKNEYNQQKEITKIYQMAMPLVIQNYIKDYFTNKKPVNTSRIISNLFFYDKKSSGFFTEFGYFQYYSDNEKSKKMVTDLTNQNYRKLSLLNYLFNNSINQSKINIKKEHLTEEGKIYIINKIIDFNVLYNVVSSTFIQETLIEILNSFDIDLLENRQEIIVYTKIGTFLIKTKNISKDISYKNILIEIININNALKNNAILNSNYENIYIPVECYESFEKDFENSFGQKYTKNNFEIINYYNCNMMKISKIKNKIKLIIKNPNTIFLKSFFENK